VVAPHLLPQDAMEALPRWRLVYTVIGAINIATCLGFFWYTWRTQRNPSFLLDLGLGLYLLSALSTALIDYAIIPWSSVSYMPMLILLWPAVVPTSPGRTLATSLLAASMDPAAALLWKAAGAEVPEMGRIVLQAFPNYMAAGLAVVISHIITRLGRKVREAREMGSYVLEALIGRGGMGEVWRARHRFLVRPAAIKLIQSKVLGAGTAAQAAVVVERFRREARAAANLRSPHTIQLYDFGVASDGTFYYVMELLGGLDLETLVSQHGPMPPARVIRLLQQTCESLGEAHDSGLIHRDIKPANIQVSRIGRDFDFAKVLDFGLVKGQTVAETPELGLTAPNTVTGTPAYLSPETGLGEPVDHRTDLYSLGCVAFWMLTGRQVFSAHSAMQMIIHHIETPPEPPSRQSGFPVSRELDEIVLACLAKRPSDRPASAWELADRLGQCEVQSPWTPEDARQWWERRDNPKPALTLGS
jgi:tRNA A-37 threonylcarbamoyl transferase component Bud32